MTRHRMWVYSQLAFVFYPFLWAIVLFFCFPSAVLDSRPAWFELLGGALLLPIPISLFVFPLRSFCSLANERTKVALYVAIASALLTIAQLFVLLPAVQ